MNNLISAIDAPQAITNLELLLNLTMSLAMGLGIFMTYRKTFQGILYQKSFNVSLVVITLIMTFIIMIIRGNLILSLGMIGALSIIRFRTPIKDPLDLIFIFWAICVGIANGVGLFHLSFVGSLFIIATLVAMLKVRESNYPYLLVIHFADKNAESEIVEQIKKSTRAHSIKSKSVNPDLVELILEIRIKNDQTAFVDKIIEIKSVKKATLVSTNENLSAY